MTSSLQKLRDAAGLDGPQAPRPHHPWRDEGARLRRAPFGSEDLRRYFVGLRSAHWLTVAFTAPTKTLTRYVSPTAMGPLRYAFVLSRL